LMDNAKEATNRKLLIDALSDSFWAIRQLAVNAFEDYTGDDLATIEKKIIEISAKDPKSVVRADAISVLTSFDTNKHKNTYLAGLKDQAYSVVGASLLGYTKTDAKDKKEVIKQYENFNNANITIPLASYFTENKDYDKFNWFEERIQKNQGGDLYYLLQFFGEFLKEAPANLQERGVKIFESYARTHSAYYIRLASFQGLGNLMEIKGVKELRDDIKAKEKDPKLLQIYERFQ
jgi:aminopeptidase N